MSELSTISKCRLCKSKRLKELFSLGDIKISTFVEKEGDDIGSAPLEMLWCENCSLVQLRHSAPQELMYSGHYWYRSGLNKMIVDDLYDIVHKGTKLAPDADGTHHPVGCRVWVDIGANDGTLLSFVNDTFMRVGVEPARNLQTELKKHADKVIPAFWEDIKVSKCDVITAIGMFYDSEDPNKFVKKVKESLADDGIFIAQMMTLEPMLKQNDVGNICHEHLEYYTYPSLKKLFERNGLEIFKVEENRINGGSLRLYARHLNTGSINYPDSSNLESIADFWKRIQDTKARVRDFVLNQVAKGKSIYLYGASTKANTILQWYGLDSNYIDGAAEISEEKIGKFTVGTNIPIVHQDEAREKADIFLVGPYGFREGFIKQEQKFLNRGGKFLFCIPEFELYEI